MNAAILCLTLLVTAGAVCLFLSLYTTIPLDLTRQLLFSATGRSTPDTTPLEVFYRRVLDSNNVTDDPEHIKFWNKQNKTCQHLTADEHFNPDWSKWTRQHSGDYPVPNIIHFLWIADEKKDIELHQAISILSAHVNGRPDAVYFHTNIAPRGAHWDIVRRIPKLRVVMRKQKKCVFGRPVTSQGAVQLTSDFERALVLLEYGGIYLDLDVVVLKPFDDFRKFPCTLGIDNDVIVCNCVIICSKFAPFLLMWVDTFLEHFSTEWAETGGNWPTRLARKYPFLVHLQWRGFFEPSDRHIDELWARNATVSSDKWKDNYTVHLFNTARRWLGYGNLNVTDIWEGQSVYAQIARGVITKARPLIGNVLGP